MWYKKFDEFVVKCGFKRSSYDSCVYTLKEEGIYVLYLLLYVDDMLIASPSRGKID
jgi:ATP-binding cassette subfamily B (MDR/TAP) protein 1